MLVSKTRLFESSSVTRIRGISRPLALGTDSAGNFSSCEATTLLMASNREEAVTGFVKYIEIPSSLHNGALRWRPTELSITIGVADVMDCDLKRRANST